MAHQRQVIREAVAAALRDKTTAGPRVFETRLVPFKRLEFPAISVYTLEETVDPDSRSTAPRELQRSLDLAIEVAVKQGDNIDDAIDAMCLEVERVMHADETFGGVASNSILASTEMVVVEENDRLVGVGVLVYSVTYFTSAPDAADVQLDDFDRAEIRHNLGGVVHVENEARDRLAGLSD